MTTKNLYIRQGSTIHFEFQLYDANNEPLSDTAGYSARAALRQSWEANSIYYFTTSLNNGILSLDMADTYSATIPANNYFWDCWLLISNTSLRVLEGTIQVSPMMAIPNA